MAGTFADKATLATDNAFISKCKVAMLFRARELTDSQTAQTYATLAKMNGILANAGADAGSMAWLVATGNATIGGAAPAIPSDGDTQFAVNTFLA